VSRGGQGARCDLHPHLLSRRHPALPGPCRSNNLYKGLAVAALALDALRLLVPMHPHDSGHVPGELRLVTPTAYDASTGCVRPPLGTSQPRPGQVALLRNRNQRPLAARPGRRGHASFPAPHAPRRLDQSGAELAGLLLYFMLSQCRTARSQAVQPGLWWLRRAFRVGLGDDRRSRVRDLGRPWPEGAGVPCQPDEPDPPPSSALPRAAPAGSAALEGRLCGA
jgi:hypothetical protein